MRLATLGILCVVCGVLAGVLLRAVPVFGGGGDVPKSEMLERGALAARAASSVLVAVRWHEEKVTISRVLCDSTPATTWRCAVRFRDGDGREMTGSTAPGVAVAFEGRGEEAEVSSCLLSDPQMGRAVDCTGRARAAVR